MSRKKTAPKKKTEHTGPAKTFDVPYQEGNEVILPCGCKFSPPRRDCGRDFTMCETHQHAFKMSEVCQELGNLGEGSRGEYDRYASFEDGDYNKIWRKAVSLLQKVKSKEPRHGDIPKGEKDRSEYLDSEGIYDMWLLETEAGDKHIVLKFGPLPYECVGTTFGEHSHSFSGVAEQKAAFDRAFAIYQMGAFGG